MYESSIWVRIEHLAQQVLPPDHRASLLTGAPEILDGDPAWPVVNLRTSDLIVSV